MKNLITPFGEIIVSIDGRATPYLPQEGDKLAGLCPRILGRYQISVDFVPDGKEHIIACAFEPNCSYERGPESGERLECVSFYNDKRYKMSIGIEAEVYVFDGIERSEYDYYPEYLETGMAYLIEKDTKTERYVFGIAWIDNVGWNDNTDYSRGRSVETWYGADPGLNLK